MPYQTSTCNRIVSGENSLMASIIFRSAKPSDSDKIGKLLSQSSMGKQVEIKFLRKPNYFDFCKIQGYKNDILIVEKDDRLLAMGSCIHQNLFIDNKLEHAVYLCDLRIDETQKNSLLLLKIYKHLKKYFEDNSISFFYTMIVHDNLKALKSIAANRKEMPVYRNLGKFHSPLVLFNKKNKRNIDNNDYKLNWSTDEMEGELIDRFNSFKKNFCPIMRKEMMGEFINKKFILLMKNNEIQASAVLWDQKKYRQTKIISYSKTLSFAKPLLNIWRFSPLPKKGKNLNYLYLTFSLSNNAENFEKLLRGICNLFYRSGYEGLIVGLHDNNKFWPVLKKFDSTYFGGNLYQVELGPEIKELSSLPELEISFI